MLVHLVNTAGPHQTEPVVDAIPLVGPLTVTIRQSVRPSKITLEPVGKSLPFEFQNGLVRLTVPHLEIHDIIVLDSGAVASLSTLPNEEQLTPYCQSHGAAMSDRTRSGNGRLRIVNRKPRRF